VAVGQDFTGAFAGRALLIFPETNSLELVRAVLGKSISLKEVIDLQDEALAEVGNIILNSWVAAIANILKRSIPMSVPVVIRGGGESIFDAKEAAATFVLFLRVRFDISHLQMRGYVALLMEVPSIQELRSLVAEFVMDITQTREDEHRGRKG
jgi:chemotaxis protein CheC